MIIASIDTIIIIFIQFIHFATSTTVSVFRICRCSGLFFMDHRNTRFVAAARISILFKLIVGQAQFSDHFIRFRTGHVVHNVCWTISGPKQMQMNIYTWNSEVLESSSEISYGLRFKFHEVFCPSFPARITSWDITLFLQKKTKLNLINISTENPEMWGLTFLCWHFQHLKL